MYEVWIQICKIEFHSAQELSSVEMLLRLFMCYPAPNCDAIEAMFKLIIEMEKCVRQMFQFVSQSANATRRMQESRMSQEEARYFFRLADTSKKGYLDLADVYHLVGNVSEQELFSIFRSLDVSKTGQVRLPDLETCLGDPSISRSTLEAGYVFACFARFIDCLKAKLQIQIQLRARFCFCRSLLSAIYRTFKETVGKEVLCCADVAKLLGQDRKGAGTLQFADIEGELRCLLGEKPLTEDTLIDIFISQQEWATRESQDRKKPIKNHETSGSDPNVHEDEKQTNLTQFRKLGPQNTASELYLSSYSNSRVIPEYGKIHADVSNIPLMGSNVRSQSVCKSIEARRSELQRDSLERRRLIEDVMQRKKQLTGVSTKKMEEWCSKVANNQLKKSGQCHRSYLGRSNQVDKLALDTRCRRQNHCAESGGGHNVRDEEEKYWFKALQGQRGEHEYPKKQPEVRLKDFRYTNEDVPARPLAANPPCVDIEQIIRKYTKQGDFEQLKPSHMNYNQEQFIPFGSKEVFGNRVGQSFSATRLQSQEITVAKENMMRRAEQETIRKIEEIERKARVKMLERKAIRGKFIK